MDTSEYYSRYRDFEWAVKLNRFGLELIGLWPKMNEIAKNNYASDLRVGIIFIIIMFVSGIPLISSLIQVSTDMILVIDNLQITLPLMVVSLKLVIIRWKQTAVSSIVKMMAEDWMALKIDAERDVMMKRARTARLIVICGYVLMIFAFTMIIVLPSFGLPFRRLTNLTDRDRPLPLPTYYFYDTDKSPQFELTLLIQATTIFLAAVTYTSVDAFLGLVILHICGQLENFKHRLDSLSSSKDFECALRNNVIAHLRLIRFADEMENTFTLMMLSLVFYFGIVFCLYGFLLLSVVTNAESNVSLSRVGYVIVGVVTLLAHTFLYCGAGEIITEQCEAICYALYDLDWYKLESREARNLILLMIRASEPFRITAGKIIPLTMTTFCTVLAGDEAINMPPQRICFVIIGIVIILTHTFLYYGAGEIVTEQCEAVYRAICNLEWYKLKPKERRILILLMVRAREPFCLTAGKICPLTMSTFCSLLKTSAGYISFLLANRKIEA